MKRPPSLIGILKLCGKRIQKLSSYINGHDQLLDDCNGLMLTNCPNLVHLTLLSQIPSFIYQLREMLGNLKLIKKLEISWLDDHYPADILKKCYTLFVPL